MSILHNNFSNDTRSGRTVRLNVFSANIEAANAELNLDTDRLNYCKGMASAWLQTTGQASDKKGVRIEQHEEYELLLDEARAYYQTCKDMIIAEIKNLTDKQGMFDHYGVEGDSPDVLGELVNKITEFIVADTTLRAQSSPYILDISYITTLTAKKTALVTAYEVFRTTLKDSGISYDNKDDMFEAHSKMLRIIYLIACEKWGKDSSKLLAIGFVPKVAQTGGQPPAKPSAIYDEETQILAIITDEEFTSAQAQTSEDEGATLSAPVDFAEGETETQILQKGSVIWARVRIRNANGFSDWSDWVIIAALILSPPGGFGYAAGKFTWVMVANATGYEMEVSYDNGGTWNQIFDGPFVVGEYTWTPPSGTHRFRIRAKGPDGLVSGWVEIVITIP